MVLHHPGANPKLFAQDASIGDDEGISLGLDGFAGQTETGSHPVVQDLDTPKGTVRFQRRTFPRRRVLCSFCPAIELARPGRFR